jgi:N-acyl-D-aspartate/D-glutamate deacylase
MMAGYDILIKSGTLFDGKGNPPKITDIGIKGEVIADIGALKNSSAKQTIDATGKYVTPGFIDITNHSDTHLTIFKYPNLESLLLQGITTIIGGNCGASLAPLASREALGAIRKWADLSEINADWVTVKEFLDTLERIGLPVNFGTLVGYGTLRRGVIGEKVKILSPEEREEIKLLLERSLKEGALGISLGLAYGHERISETEEIIDIVKPVREYGGLVKIHLRSEGKDIFPSVNEALRIAREADVPVEISHMKAIGRKAWIKFNEVLSLIDNAVSSGIRVNFDVSPYATTGSSLYLLIPAWAREGGFEELFQKIDNSKDREKILEELKSYTIHPDKIVVVSAKMPNLTGYTLEEIASRSGLSPEETLLEIVRSNEGRVSIIGKTVSAVNVKRALMHPASLIASDGAGYSEDEKKSGVLVHPRSFGAFPHFWHVFVKEKGLLSPEEAIRKMTYAPALKFGLKNRGEIRKGSFADILIFTPETFEDRATYQNPYQYPVGLDWVLINGKIAVKEGKIQGIKAGNILRK